MKIDRDWLLGEVMWRAAIPDAQTAETAVEATLEALGERLSARDAAAFAERRLPPEWGTLFVLRQSAQESASPPGPVPGHGHTLATGRPGRSSP